MLIRHQLVIYVKLGTLGAALSALFVVDVFKNIAGLTFQNPTQLL